MVWIILGSIAGGLIGLGIIIGISLWLFKEFWRAKYKVEEEKAEKDELVSALAGLSAEQIRNIIKTREVVSKYGGELSAKDMEELLGIRNKIKFGGMKLVPITEQAT